MRYGTYISCFGRQRCGGSRSSLSRFTWNCPEAWKDALNAWLSTISISSGTLIVMLRPSIVATAPLMGTSRDRHPFAQTCRTADEPLLS
jgi:hypothetical protein